MVISLLISRHAAADCPANNERWRKVTLDAMSKSEELAAKHGVTILGAWVVHSEHLVVQVFEAASFEALQAFSAEPVIMNALNYQTTEMKLAVTMQESMQHMMQA